jgi:Putative transposase
VRIVGKGGKQRHCPLRRLTVTELSINSSEASHISAIAYTNKEIMYGLLFDIAAETLRTIGADPKHLGARIGLTLVLHTWGSALTHHPHVHGIVPGGGLALAAVTSNTVASVQIAIAQRPYRPSSARSRGFLPWALSNARPAGVASTGHRSPRGGHRTTLNTSRLSVTEENFSIADAAPAEMSVRRRRAQTDSGFHACASWWPRLPRELA